MSFIRALAFTIAAAFAPPTFAVTIDFEGFADSTVLTNQLVGVTFANTTVLSAGISLNEFEFPPQSGTNVVFDDGGAIDILFGSPQGSVGGFFTYLAPLTLTAFDASNNILGSITSSFLTNLALSGDLGSAPNEFLSLAFGGIQRVTITGDALGSSFTLDDLTFSPPTATVPEPSTGLLLTVGAMLLMRTRVRRREHL